MKHCKKLAAIASALLVLGFTACSSDGDGGSGSTDPTPAGIPATSKPSGTTPKTPASTATTTTGPTGTTGATGITTNGTPTTNRTPSANGLVKPTYKTVYNVTEDTYIDKIDEIIAKLAANDPSQPKEFEFKFSGTKEITYKNFVGSGSGNGGFKSKMSNLKSNYPDVRVGMDFSLVKVDDDFITSSGMFNSGLYKSIVFPKKISDGKKLGTSYFLYCKYLEFIKFPDNLSGFERGQSFANDVVQGVSLQIEIPTGIEVVAQDYFKYARNLTTLVLNEGLAKIESYAFAGDEKLKSVDFPSTLTDIENYAFKDCKKLEKVKLNNGLKKIGNYAFNNCKTLETIDFPSTLTKIGDSAFCDTGLKKVIIPENITTMGQYIFFNSFSLDTVEVYTTKITNSVLNGSYMKTLVLGEKVVEIGANNFNRDELTSVVFKNPEGWKCDGVPVDAAILKDPAAAATYLKTNKDKVFTRQ